MADCLVVGPGGVGGYLAAVLAAGGLEVAVVGRGAHAEAMARDGLRLDDAQRPGLAPQRVAVAASLDEAPPAAAVVVAVKHGSLAALAAPLPAYLARCPDDAVLVLVQNGVSHLDGPVAAAAPGRLLAGSVYIFSHIAAPGVIRCDGGPRLYRFGPLDPGDAALRARAGALAAQWQAAGLNAAAEADGRRVAWQKLCLLAPLSGLTAATGRTVGELRELPEAVAAFGGMVEEVRSIGVAAGVDIDPAMAGNATVALRNTEPAGRSSLSRDLDAGRDSELDVLLGDPLRRADALGVAAPALRAVYAVTRVRYGVDLAQARAGDPEATRAAIAASGAP
jgi:2-dehydropantoate 2-reductase